MRLPYVVLALAIVALDRVTKAAILAAMHPYHSVPIVPGFFDLTFVQNPGGVFGVFKSLDEPLRGLLFTIVPVGAIILIAAYARKVDPSRRLTHASLALILGGAVGNLIDRFRYGYVVDFLDLHVSGWHWPAFNVADSAICVGVALLMIETLFVPETPRARQGAPAAGPAEPAGGDRP